MIAYYASDLAWAMRIKACADDVGVEARPVRDLESVERAGAGGFLHGLIVDLADPGPAVGLIQAVRESERRAKRGEQIPPRVRIVAFGPHLETQALAAARAAGADEVLARGAFASRLPDILRHLDDAERR